MSLRADLESAYWEHWRKALRDNPRDGLPAYLDAIEAIFAEEAKRLGVPSLEHDAEVQEFFTNHPGKAARPPVRGTRRSTTRKADG